MKSQRVRTQIRLLSNHVPPQEIRRHWLRYLTELWPGASKCRLAIMALIWCLVENDYVGEIKAWYVAQLKAGNRLVAAVAVYEGCRSELARQRIWQELGEDLVNIAKISQSSFDRITTDRGHLLNFADLGRLLDVKDDYNHEPKEEEQAIACRVVMPNTSLDALPSVLSEILTYQEWRESTALDLQRTIFGLLTQANTKDLVAPVFVKALDVAWPVMVTHLKRADSTSISKALAELIGDNLGRLTWQRREELLNLRENLFVITLGPKLLWYYTEPRREITLFLQAAGQLWGDNWRLFKNAGLSLSEQQSHLASYGATLAELLDVLPLPLIRQNLLKGMVSKLPAQVIERFRRNPSEFREVFGPHVADGKAPLEFVTTSYLNYYEETAEDLRNGVIQDIQGWLCNYPVTRIGLIPDGDHQPLLRLLEFCRTHGISYERLELPQFKAVFDAWGVDLPITCQPQPDPQQPQRPRKKPVVPRPVLRFDSGGIEPMADRDTWIDHFSTLVASRGYKLTALVRSLIRSLFLPDDPAGNLAQWFLPACTERPALRTDFIDFAFPDLTSYIFQAEKWQDDKALAFCRQMTVQVILLAEANQAWLTDSEKETIGQRLAKGNQSLFFGFHATHRDFLDKVLPYNQQLDCFYAKATISRSPRYWVPWLVKNGQRERLVSWVRQQWPAPGAGRVQIANWIWWATYVKDTLTIRQIAARWCEMSVSRVEAHDVLRIIDPDYLGVYCQDAVMHERERTSAVRS